MEIASLAPAAGAGIGKLIADRLLADPEFMQLMQDAITNALRATVRHWDREAKRFEVDPDFKTQLSAFSLVMAHMEGEPVKRIIHQHLGGAGAPDPLEALRESPALRDAAKALLEKAEWRTSGQKAHKKPKKAEPAAIEPEIEV